MQELGLTTRQANALIGARVVLPRKAQGPSPVGLRVEEFSIKVQPHLVHYVGSFISSPNFLTPEIVPLWKERFSFEFEIRLQHLLDQRKYAEVDDLMYNSSLSKRIRDMFRIRGWREWLRGPIIKMGFISPVSDVFTGLLARRAYNLAFSRVLHMGPRASMERLRQECLALEISMHHYLERLRSFGS